MTLKGAKRMRGHLVIPKSQPRRSKTRGTMWRCVFCGVEHNDTPAFRLETCQGKPTV